MGWWWAASCLNRGLRRFLLTKRRTRRARLMRLRRPLDEKPTSERLVPQALQLFLNGIEREVRRQKKEKQFEQLLSIAVRLPFNWRRFLFGSVHKRFGGR